MNTLRAVSLLSLISAHDYKFLDHQDGETNLIQIGTGACINWNYERSRFWDLKELDAAGRTGNEPVT
jgi:hypothetical protein